MVCVCVCVCEVGVGGYPTTRTEIGVNVGKAGWG